MQTLISPKSCKIFVCVCVCVLFHREPAIPLWVMALSVERLACLELVGHSERPRHV